MTDTITKGEPMLLEMTVREVAAQVHEQVDGRPGSCDSCLAVTEAVLGILCDDPRGLLALAVGTGAVEQVTPLLYRRVA